MNQEELESIWKATYARILTELGYLGDLPYELANTVANVYWRHFEAVFDSSWQAPDMLEFDQRKQEYQIMSKIIPAFRAMRYEGAHTSVIEYTAEHLLNVFKHRIPDADSKMPIVCRMQRFFYRGQDRERLVDHLRLYRRV